MIAEPFAPEVFPRLLKSDLIHVALVRFHLQINLGVRRFQQALRRRSQNRIVQQALNPGQRIFQLASVWLRGRLIIVFDLRQQSARA